MTVEPRTEGTSHRTSRRGARRSEGEGHGRQGLGVLTRWAGGREAGVVAREGARQEQVGEAGGGWVAWVPPGLARGGV